MRIDSIAFHAKYVCSPKIKVKSHAKYFSYPVSFVELEPFNERDIDAIARVSSLWGPLTLAYEICNDMKQKAENLKSISEKFQITELAILGYIYNLIRRSINCCTHIINRIIFDLLNFFYKFINIFIFIKIF